MRTQTLNGKIKFDIKKQLEADRRREFIARIASKKQALYIALERIKRND